MKRFKLRIYTLNNPPEIRSSKDPKFYTNKISVEKNYAKKSVNFVKIKIVTIAVIS